ncbi:MAG: hypothetical protein GY847_42145 [Proteobacteria bacterium]|nr:hypothetical protein [Pseudomonadota bacterium]
MEAELAELGSVILVIEKMFEGEDTIESAYQHLEMFGFENAYLTHMLPKINIAFSPFTFIVDLEYMKVLAKDDLLDSVFGGGVSDNPKRILKLAERAFND